MEAIRRNWARFTDASTCALLNMAQWRHRSQASTREDLEAYLATCERLSREEFYSAPALTPVEESAGELAWPSPHESGLDANDRASAWLQPCERGWSAPTVLILHALMSVNDLGYRRLATKFNALGWNAAFLHLPFHYGRRPRGYLNGELAVTAHVVRTAEGLRQGVSESRQLMAWLRARGCREFGVFGTSYGAWTGALLASLERDLSFIALLQPIADVDHAIWESPASATMRRALRRNGIDAALTRRHAHLPSPLHGKPATSPDRIVMAIGQYDRIAPPDRVEALAGVWGGARVITRPQGHFGYVAARDMFGAVREMIG
ncbi:MAG: alpha/beta fold hydrolase [Chthoniobacterales bacterium]